jgi:hypothetical protein
MDFIENEGAVSDELTSVLLAVSEKWRPLRVKRAAKTRETRGQFRRIQVANSREIRWRKPVKSAPIGAAFGLFMRREMLCLRERSAAFIRSGRIIGRSA